MPIKERDIVLQGRDGGEDTIDLPITRLANVESGAEVKVEPAQGDYIPIIDTADNEQMKKFPAKVLVDAADTAERALKAVQRVAYVIDTLPYQTAALTFTGEEQNPVWGAFDPEKLEMGGDTSAVHAGEYEVTFTPKGDYVWSDESAQPRTVKWSIGRAAAAVPGVTGSLVYTGEEQSPAWSGYDAGKMEISGDTAGTNAGNYTAVFTPNADHQWLDGTTEEKMVSWSVGRAVIAAVPVQSGSLTYTGKAQSPVWTGYDANKLTLGGDTSAVNAGNYTASFTPGANYQWNDGTTGAKTVGWSIGRAVVAVPSQSGSRTYTGSAQSPAWSNYDAGKLTLGGTTSGVNAGSYTASFTPKENYCWNDGTTGARNVGWSIGKAAGSLALSTANMSLGVAASSGYITVNRAGDGAISAWSSNTGVAEVSLSGNTVTVTRKASGSAVITVSVGEGTNHNAPRNATCNVSVALPSTVLNNNSWDMIRQVSDAGQGANWWSVGDTKAITINGTVGNTTFSSLAIDVFILGFNHNSSREGSNRIHFQIGKIGGKLVGLVDSRYQNECGVGYFTMNSTFSNNGGWAGSYMRQTLLGNSNTPTSPLTGSLMAAIPTDLRAVMKSVTKYSDNTGGGSDTASYVTATTDYLFLLAEFECQGGNGGYANSAEKNFQVQYDYYKAGNTKVHNKHNETSKAAYAWCRSAFSKASGTFCNINPSGGTTGSYANISYAIVSAFCV